MNKVNLKGNLVDNLKKHQMANGKEMYTGAIGVWKGKNETQDFGSDFFEFSFFDEKSFDIVSKFKKGEKVQIEGKLSIMKNKETGYNQLKITAKKMTLVQKNELGNLRKETKKKDEEAKVEKVKTEEQKM